MSTSFIAVALIVIPCSAIVELKATDSRHAERAEAQTSGWQIHGLKTGEEWVELGPAPPWTPTGFEQNWQLWPGRVVDAFTGRPIAAARIELWSEEIDPVHGGFHRYDESTSRQDGRFWINHIDGGRHAEKARIMAPGYLTWSGTAGELRSEVVELFPAHDRAPEIRVIDGLGRPLPGAVFTSTYSCSHDVPAFEVRSDATGLAVFPTFGLQNSVQEFRLRIPDHASVEYLSGQGAFDRLGPTTPGAAEAIEPWTVARPRMSGVRGKVLRRNGASLSHTPLRILDGEGYHVVTTDLNGSFEIRWPYSHDSMLVYILNERDDFVGEVVFPPNQEVVLRVDGDRWPEKVATGEIEVVLPSDADSNPFLQILMDHGWIAERNPDRDGRARFTVPAGNGSLRVGGAFRGHTEQILPFHLAAGERLQLEPLIEPQPRVRFLWPEGAQERWIESGQDSLTEDSGGLPDAEEWLPVSALRRLNIHYRLGREIHLLHLDKVYDGQTIDLASVPVWPGSAAPEPPLRGVNLVIASPNVDEVELRLEWPLEGMTLIPDPAQVGLYHLEGSAGSSFLLRVNGKGLIQSWVRGRIPSSPSSLNNHLVPVVAAASITIVAEHGQELEGAEIVGLDQVALHPGPLSGVLRLADGTRFGLRLMLAPGEHRVLRLSRAGD